MAYVTVPKDLTRVKSKVVLGLTKRQLICFGGALLVGVPLFLFRFSQTKATVLNWKPHALISCKASGSCGNVAHKNSRQSFFASFPTGRAHSSSMLMVG